MLDRLEQHFSPQNFPLISHPGDPDRTFSIYIHVPFCAVRCGYCDFNTYTAQQLGDVRREDFSELVCQEICFAAEALDMSSYVVKPLTSVFFGGGTPTLLTVEHIERMLHTLRKTFPFREDCEVTIEANPDSLSSYDIGRLASIGITRISFGMQSANVFVLSQLDRTHNCEIIPELIESAKKHHLQISLDLIYGTPGETLEMWQQSVHRALSYETDHVSAYSLIVEPGTALARRIRLGELQPVDGDLQADMYRYAESAFYDAGLNWYEISNWSTSEQTQSKHNIAYWENQDWWGFGPGAHSHVGSLRWWNVKHPSAYGKRVQRQLAALENYEILNEEMSFLERVLLSLRTIKGIERSVWQDPAVDAVIQRFCDEGLLDGKKYQNDGVLRLTFDGRLLANRVIENLVSYR